MRYFTFLIAAGFTILGSCKTAPPIASADLNTSNATNELRILVDAKFSDRTLAIGDLQALLPPDGVVGDCNISVNGDGDFPRLIARKLDSSKVFVLTNNPIANGGISIPSPNYWGRLILCSSNRFPNTDVAGYQQVIFTAPANRLNADSTKKLVSREFYGFIDRQTSRLVGAVVTEKESGSGETSPPSSGVRGLDVVTDFLMCGTLGTFLTKRSTYVVLNRFPPTE